MIKVNVYLTDVVKTGARPGTKINDLIGVTIHNTDNDGKGANAEAHGNLLRGSWKDKQQSWHYTVDDKEAYQSIPENEVAWHAGDGRGNGNYKTIAIEICMNKDGNIEKATDNAAQLTADILKRHGLPATAVFQHNHWSGKNCPGQIRKGIPYDWETFVSKVNKYYSDGKQPVDKPAPAPKPPVTKIDEDGYWGIETTKLAQKVFGTEVDGIISNQYKMYQSKNPGLQSDTWQWMDAPGTAGSQLIRAIQRWVGASVNGYGGHETFSKMQRKLGTTQDGIVSAPSQMVKAFQKYLNKQ